MNYSEEVNFTRNQILQLQLRNRLFDISKRNRLLYYKPNVRFINLTHLSAILFNSNNQKLLYWNEETSKKTSLGKDLIIADGIDTNEYPYFNDIFNKIRLEANKNVHEFGFSSLRLVAAFLHWNHPIENPEEKISSPLILLPVNLVKKKSLKEQYILEIQETEAEVNPVLIYVFKKLFNLTLPDKILLEEETLHQFYQTIQQQIASTKSNITIVLRDIPDSIQLQKDAQILLSKLQFKKKINLQEEDNIYQDFKKYLKHHPLLNVLTGNRFPSINLSKHNLCYKNKNFANNLNWEFDLCNLVLGNFNYKKMSLVSDYNEIIEHQKTNPIFNLLFNESPKTYENKDSSTIAFSELYNVIASDPTQNKAIQKARNLSSYIIQGPPGTGKSQTITNLIADFVANGKKVLFVCEKRAAIDVVYYRLKQENLDELCCLIHDSQADKKAFILNLKSNYETSLKNNTDIEDIINQRNEVIQYMQQELKIIAHFTQLMQVEIESANLKSIDIYNKLIELNEFTKNLQDVNLDEIAGYKEWTRFGETIEALCIKLKSHNHFNYFAEHPISLLNDLMIDTAPSPAELKAKLSEIAALNEEITEYLEIGDFDENYKENINDLKQLLHNSDELKIFLDAGQSQLINENSEAYHQFLKYRNELLELDKDIEHIQQKNKNWKHKFSETDTENALQIAHNLEDSIFRIFYGNYRKMKNSINHAYDFLQHQIKPKYSQVLQHLKQEYQITNLQNKKITEAEKIYQLGNLEEIFLKIEDCRQQLHPEILALIQENNHEIKLQELLVIKSKFDRLLKLILQVLDHRNIKSFSAVEKTTESILPVIDDFSTYLPYLTSLSNTSPRLKQLIKTKLYSPKQIQTILAQKSLDDFYILHKEIQKIEGNILEFHIERIKKLQHQFLKINSTFIRSKQRSKFMKLVSASEISVAGKSEKEKDEKKKLQEGRKILENEFAKTMRHKSIRTLASAESGKFIRELKPVWLMSPLSISDTLPLDTQYFDVVIFDEASQINIEEGIPTVFRASQAIIVGDEMQMPPTNFFGANNNDTEDIWQVENKHQINLEADSLLNQAARNLPAVMLGWHYRSRHECLISFSNAAFYQNQLLTIPDKTDTHQTLNEILVLDTSDAEQNYNYLFDRPISYHFLQNGIYESRTNEAEAEYVAALLHQLYLNKNTESIGIVAFSIEQQNEIENAIDEKAFKDKAFGKWLEEEYKREKDNQFIGLFVKNLENVQGDERDIIIISTCYGYDKQKKMLMNFGPINRKGGEKRLNVIFSRAKQQVCIVSSIRHSDIKNVHNEGANFFKKYLEYAELMSTGNLVHAQSILNSLFLKQIKPEESTNHLQQQICEEMKALGYFTKINIGQSHFKCHIGIKKNKNDKDFMLGIILDDNLHYSNTDLIEQYLQKPNILMDFGWHILSVYTKDWLENKAKVIQTIIAKLVGNNKIISSENTTELNTEDLLNKRISLTEDRQKKIVDNFNTNKNTSTIRLLLEEKKYWQITQNKSSLVIEFGKLNTNGQKIIKSYETESEASKEMKKLIEQKKKKGFKLA